MQLLNWWLKCITRMIQNIKTRSSVNAGASVTASVFRNDGLQEPAASLERLSIFSRRPEYLCFSSMANSTADNRATRRNLDSEVLHAGTRKGPTRPQHVVTSCRMHITSILEGVFLSFKIYVEYTISQLIFIRAVQLSIFVRVESPNTLTCIGPFLILLQQRMRKLLFAEVYQGFQLDLASKVELPEQKQVVSQKVGPKTFLLYY